MNGIKHHRDTLAFRLNDAESEYYEERAAIREYEAGMSRDAAEVEAMREVLAQRRNHD